MKPKHFKSNSAAKWIAVTKTHRVFVDTNISRRHRK